MNTLAKFIASSLFLAPFVSFADLPTSPLATEYTLSETLNPAINSKYVVNSTGVLNIGSDVSGAGELKFTFDTPTEVFKTSGTINIGTETTSGLLSFVSSCTGASTTIYPTIFSNTGTVNINKMGTLSVSGVAFDHYGNYDYLGNINVYGLLSLTGTSTNPYHSLTGVINLYAGGKISVTGTGNLVLNGGTLNLYGGAFTSYPQIRTHTSGGTINVQTANIMNSHVIQMDSKGSNAKLVLGNYKNNLKSVRFYTESKFTLALQSDKTGIDNFQIATLDTKDATRECLSSDFIIENFANDFLLLGGKNLTVTEDGILNYLSGNSAYTATVQLKAYLGDSSGAALDGKWSLVKDDVSGLYFLNNSAIPEPATCAVILGALALGAVLVRRRK